MTDDADTESGSGAEPDIDRDDVQRGAGNLDEVELEEGGPIDNASRWQLIYSYAYLTLLALALLGAGYLIWWLIAAGYIETDLAVSATADVGWVIEYLVAGVVLVFLIWTFIQIMKVTGVSFWNRVFDGLASIADSYERPGKEDDDHGER